MNRAAKLQTAFVRTIPEALDDGTLYVSMEYATVVHKCCCGCGKEVVTPLSPTDWKLTFDGETVSLFPSVGNWSFACQSHYWIDKSRIRWAGRMTPKEIAEGRAHDRFAKERQYSAKSPTPETKQSAKPDDKVKPANVWSRLAGWWSKRNG